MTSKFGSAFDCIYAEDALKSVTTRFLYSEIQKRAKPGRRIAAAKFAVGFVCVLILFLSGTFAYNIYITPAAYVDLDINPSVELTLNRFDRVIGAYAYNEDGIDIIEGISIKHKNYNDALTALMDIIDGQGYLQKGELISVTLQTDDKTRENELLSGIQTGIERYMTDRSHTAQIDVFPVSGDVRNDSYAQDITPAKYLAILELIEVDPSASVENCRGHSISEIRQLTLEHGRHHGDTENNDISGNDGNNHHGGKWNNQDKNSGDTEQEENITTPTATITKAPAVTAAQSGTHHSESKSGGHRGGHN